MKGAYREVLKHYCAPAVAKNFENLNVQAQNLMLSALQATIEDDFRHILTQKVMEQAGLMDMKTDADIESCLGQMMDAGNESKASRAVQSIFNQVIDQSAN